MRMSELRTRVNKISRHLQMDEISDARDELRFLASVLDVIKEVKNDATAYTI